MNSFAERLVLPRNMIIAGAVGALVIAFAGPVGFVVAIVVWLGLAAATKANTTTPTKVSHHNEVVDPYAIGDPWRGLLLQARNVVENHRTKQSVRTMAISLQSSFDDAYAECAQIASQGDAIDDAIRASNVERLRSDLTMADAELQRNRDPQREPALTGRRDALNQQITTVQDLEGRSQHILDQLREVVAKLEDAALQSVAATAPSRDVAAVLGSRAERVLNDARALRLAVDEVDRISKQAGLS